MGWTPPWATKRRKREPNPLKPGARVKDAAAVRGIDRAHCFWCGAYGRVIHAAHGRSRGAGGDDLAAESDGPRRNVFPLCCDCHKSHHDGNGPTFDEIRARWLRDLAERRADDESRLRAGPQ